jgi:hypothetical protein
MKELNMPANAIATTPLPFDIHTLFEHLNNKDQLALIIRAHLYVEAILIRKIEAALVKRERFDCANLTFPNKVKLAVAIGRIDDADRAALIALNGLRNRFAHRLDTQLQEQDELELYSSLSKRQSKFVDELRNTDGLDYTARLRCDLAGLIIATNEAVA